MLPTSGKKQVEYENAPWFCVCLEVRDHRLLHVDVDPHHAIDKCSLGH